MPCCTSLHATLRCSSAICAKYRLRNSTLQQMLLKYGTSAVLNQFWRTGHLACCWHEVQAVGHALPLTPEPVNGSSAAQLALCWKLSSRQAGMPQDTPGGCERLHRGIQLGELLRHMTTLIARQQVVQRLAQLIGSVHDGLVRRLQRLHAGRLLE